MQALRLACALVSARASQVRIELDSIHPYAAGLELGRSAPATTGAPELAPTSEREPLAARWLTLAAINFGSGWFPTLRKRDRSTGYHTVAAGLWERFERHGPWSPTELSAIGAAEIAAVLGQPREHELMALFADSLADLGAHVTHEHQGSFASVVDTAAGSAVALAERLGGWACFADRSSYGELEVEFLKRAQLAAADLHRAGVARFEDLDQLTMFADNLVPHVLRLDGVLRFSPALLGRIDRGELIQHGSAEEVEIRACTLHAVELIVAAWPQAQAAEVDQLLWCRGQLPHYKAVPRHRSRCTAY